jgi:hypothetical protein
VCIIVIKDDTIVIFFYAKHALINNKRKADCFGVRIMCLSGGGKYYTLMIVNFESKYKNALH